MSILINDGNVYCKHCKGLLEEPFEKNKSVHWECEIEMIKHGRVVKEENRRIVYIYTSNIEYDLYNELHIYDDPLTNVRPVIEIRTMHSNVIYEAIELWGLHYDGYYPDIGFGMAILRPKHFQSAIYPDNWTFNCTNIDTWVYVKNGKAINDCYIMVHGFVLKPDEDIYEICFEANGRHLPVYNIDAWKHIANETNDYVIYLQKPFAIPPTGYFGIRAKCLTTGIKTLKLIGTVIGKSYLLLEE